jgi:hypothetical protein
VREAINGGPGGGKYLPVSAIQNFDASVSLTVTVMIDVELWDLMIHV